MTDLRVQLSECCGFRKRTEAPAFAWTPLLGSLLQGMPNTLKSSLVPGKMVGAPAWLAASRLPCQGCVCQHRAELFPVPLFLLPRGLLTRGPGREHVALGDSPGYSVDRALGALQLETQGAEGTFQKPAKLLSELALPHPQQLLFSPCLALAAPGSISRCVLVSHLHEAPCH